jgi:diguanylate cyclase (GGDEF)-like protein
MALILIVEDDAEINSLMTLTLRVEDYDVMQARDGATALKLVHEHPPDLILLDVMMPAMSGYDVARELQDRPSTAHIPIIFVTAKSDMEDRVHGLEMAVDYVCKPFAAPELLARVRAALRMRKLQDELRISNEQLAKLATTDPLTGLSNRRVFDSEMEIEVQRARRFKHPLAVLMCDLDHFKSVNDTYGHAQGDVVLQNFAATLSGTSRRIDTVARLGGEEFGVILPATDGPGAESFAEKLRKTVADTQIPCRTREGVAAQPISITVSIGIAVALEIVDGEIDVASHASDLVQCADLLLYQSKANGRNCVSSRILSQLPISD